MNFINIAGHLGADPETRFTSAGKKVTTLRVATKVRKGQNDETIWWRVSVWGDQFDKMMPHFKKGSPIIVTGEIQKPEIFNDREGKPQISMDITASSIQFSPFGKPNAGSPQEGSGFTNQEPPSSAGSAPNPYMAGSSMSSGKGDTFDDEIPF